MTRLRTLITIILTSLVTLLPATGLSNTEPDGQGVWRLELKLASRVNPVGLALRPALGYRISLSDSDHLLLKGTHIETGFLGAVSPASFHPGMYVTLVPIAPLVLRLRVQQLRYFGLFGNLSEYDGLEPDWRDEVRQESITGGRHETAIRAQAQAQFRIFYEGLALMTQYTFGLYQADIGLGGSWYESSDDLLLARNDQAHRVDSLVGWYVSGTPFSEEHLLLGGLWQGHWVEKTNVRRHIGGGVVGYRPGWLRERRLTALFLFARYFEDAYRTGEFYFGSMISMSWEALSSKPNSQE
ncbi:MAG: hypothetical protein CMH52_05685 [Myxococcales bacterium]|nr:hypothetical protein [Myxococcales bacterium]